MPTPETLTALKELAAQTFSEVEGVQRVSVAEVVNVTTFVRGLSPDGEGEVYRREAMIIDRFPHLNFDFHVIREQPEKGKARSVRIAESGSGPEVVYQRP